MKSNYFRITQILNQIIKEYKSLDENKNIKKALKSIFKINKNIKSIQDTNKILNQNLHFTTDKLQTEDFLIETNYLYQLFKEIDNISNINIKSNIITSIENIEDILINIYTKSRDEEKYLQCISKYLFEKKLLN